MCGQWAVLGASDHAEQTESMNKATSAQVSAVAASALRAVSRCDAGDDEANEWCVFSPEPGIWRFRPNESRQAANLH
jgi:hypothetical protein